MRKKLSILLLVTFIAVLASSCTSPSVTPPVVTAQPKIFRFSDTYDVKSLNGHNDVDTLVHDILLYTHSALYRRVPTEDGKAAIYVGDIADGDPVLMDEGYVWRIKLREEAKWHNGEPINADTIIYSFKMLDRKSVV